MLNHIGIVNRDDESAVLFYQDFLGIEKKREFMVGTDLAEQLFSISREIKVLVFEKKEIKIEVFIVPDFSLANPNLFHIGLAVKDLDNLIASAKEKGLEVIIGIHSGKKVHFVKDFSGNLIEIKQSHN